MGYLNFTDALTQAKRNSILTGRPFSMGDYNNLQSAYMSGATARANAARSQALTGEAAGSGGALGAAAGGLGAAGIGAATPAVLNAIKSNATREIGRAASLGLVSDKRLSSAIGGGLSGAGAGALAGPLLIPIPGAGAVIGGILGGLGGGIMEGISGFGGRKQFGYEDPDAWSKKYVQRVHRYTLEPAPYDEMQKQGYNEYVLRHNNIINRDPNLMLHLRNWTPEQLDSYNQAGLMNEKDWIAKYMPDEANPWKGLYTKPITSYVDYGM